MIGKPYLEKLNVLFDEGKLEIEHQPLRQLSTLAKAVHSRINSQPSTFSGITILILAILIFSFGSIRIVKLILHHPLLGYANSFDMIRIQACHQIWPADPNVQPGTMTYQAPLENYKFDKTLNLGFCHYNSELIFTIMGEILIRLLQPHLIGDTFSIRIFGLIRGASLIFIGLGFLIWCILQKQYTTALIHVLIYTIVIADPANTLYLNTFYTEFSALFFAYLSCLIFYRVSFGIERSITALVFGITLFLLGASKLQHIGLPLIFFISFIFFNWHNIHTKKLTAVFALLGVISSGIYQEFLRHTPSMDAIEYANATDTFLLTVLPATSDPYSAAKILKLPDHCVEHRGKTWYTPGVQENHPCPEVRNVSRVRIIWLALHDPQFVINVTREGIKLLRGWLLSHVGSIGNVKLERASRIVFSLSDWIDQIPDTILKALFLAPFIIILWVIGWMRSCNLSNTIRCGAAIIVLLGLSTFYVFYSSLFGDGYCEFSKHTHLYFSFYIALIVILMFMMIIEGKNIFLWLYLRGISLARWLMSLR
jgi:hypothetical protein